MSRASLLVAILLGLAGPALDPGRAVEAVAPQGTVRHQPDFNGDGRADLAVGVPLEDLADHNEGAVQVLYGSTSGLAAAGNQFWTQDSPGVPNRSTSQDRFGWSVAPADFDGDGFTDLAISTKGETVGGAVNAGSVTVLFGSRDGLVSSGSQFWTQNSRGVMGAAEEGDLFGWAMTTGDFDGDGYADLAIGTPEEDLPVPAPEFSAPSAGALTVLYGSAAGLSARDQYWTQDSPGIANVAEEREKFGRALAASDFDGDGRDDLAVATPYEDDNENRAGIVHILHGAAGGLTATGSQVWSQDSPGIANEQDLRDQFGLTLAAGDFDGDDRGDLAVGTWFEDFCFICNQGAVNVIYGSASGLSAAGSQFWTQNIPGSPDQREPFDRFGNALVASDFNGDRRADLAIGAPREDLVPDRVFQDQGSVNVLYGASGGLDAAGNQWWTQDTPGVQDGSEKEDLFGMSLGSGDFDGDGMAELVVGVRYEDFPTAKNGGALHVLPGRPGGLTAIGDQFWTQDSPGIADHVEAGDSFGYSLSSDLPTSGSPGASRPDYRSRDQLQLILAGGDGLQAPVSPGTWRWPIAR